MNNIDKAPGEKIIKSQDGNAYIAIGPNYIRIGNSETYIILDENNINIGAKNVNWEMSPESMTYRGAIRQPSLIEGLIPFYPHYTLASTPFTALANTVVTSIFIGTALGIGI